MAGQPSQVGGEAIGRGAVAVIPARHGSSRFPGKPLADATGSPMIVHVCRRAAASCVARVVVATDDERIVRAVEAAGFEAVMTSADCANGTVRIAEAARHLHLDPQTVIVNVQGDEPEIEPAVIDAAVGALERSPAPVSTVASPFGPGDDPCDPNLVKVVVDRQGLALYFSRSAVPYQRVPSAGSAPLRHVGLYVYRRSFVERYLAMEPTPLELAEQLEQLRILEHGERIAVAVCPGTCHGIDTPEQYEAFVQRERARREGHSDG